MIEENVEIEEKPVLTYFKRADKGVNKIIIPKKIIECWGNEYIMEVYKNKIVLIPLSKMKKDE